MSFGFKTISDLDLSLLIRDALISRCGEELYNLSVDPDDDLAIERVADYKAQISEISSFITEISETQSFDPSCPEYYCGSCLPSDCIHSPDGNP